MFPVCTWVSNAQKWTFSLDGLSTDSQQRNCSPQKREAQLNRRVGGMPEEETSSPEDSCASNMDPDISMVQEKSTRRSPLASMAAPISSFGEIQGTEPVSPGTARIPALPATAEGPRRSPAGGSTLQPPSPRGSREQSSARSPAGGVRWTLGRAVVPQELEIGMASDEDAQRGDGAQNEHQSSPRGVMPEKVSAPVRCFDRSLPHDPHTLDLVFRGLLARRMCSP